MDLLATIELLRPAIVDGRTDNVRYRQKELHSLHSTLSSHAEAIISAITADLDSSSKRPEAYTEYYLALNSVKELYNRLDFGQSMRNEYLIAKGVDNPSRRVGKGLVVIRPTTHTRFYSIICPLATAIAAGNCNCLNLDLTGLKIDQVLNDLLPMALDMDTFQLSISNYKDLRSLLSALVVDQTSISSAPTTNQLASIPSARTIVFVDRTADIDRAAESVVKARFSFQGTSPYSPDLVIVNDFVKSEFLDACASYTSKLFSTDLGTKQVETNDVVATKDAVKRAKELGHISLLGSSNFVIVDLHQKDDSISKMKITGCHLVITDCTSLIDAVTSQDTEALLALYIFADASSAKFLAQYLPAQVTYINQIPLHLMIGPAMPLTSHAPPPYHKYSVEMFSSARPQYTSSPPSDLLVIDKIFDSPEHDNHAKLLKSLESSATAPLKKIDQSEGFAIGFFEQGILLGLGMFLTVFVPAVGYSSWLLWRSAWRMAVR